MVDVKTGFGKYIWIIGVVALFGTGGLFAYLESLGLQVICEDKVCEVGVECIISCNVTNPTSKSIYLFNHDDWKVTFSPDIVDVDIYVKYYGKWRYTNFTKETRFGNIPDDRLYVFVFTRYSKKEFQLRTVVQEPMRIKWDFGSLDPIIVAYEYKYENLSKQIPIYKEKVIEVKPVYYEKNDSWSEGYNYKSQTVIGYKTKYYNGKKVGVIVGGKEINNPNVYINNDEKTLNEWNIPIGKRNFEDPELGQGCRKYEIDKGVCRKVSLE